MTERNKAIDECIENLHDFLDGAVVIHVPGVVARLEARFLALKSKRYTIVCHVFDGMGEDNSYELFADTLDEASDIAADEDTEEEEDGRFISAEIVDTAEE